MIKIYNVLALSCIFFNCSVTRVYSLFPVFSCYFHLCKQEMRMCSDDAPRTRERNVNFKTTSENLASNKIFHPDERAPSFILKQFKIISGRRLIMSFEVSWCENIRHEFIFSFIYIDKEQKISKLQYLSQVTIFQQSNLTCTGIKKITQISLNIYNPYRTRIFTEKPQ